MAHPCCYWTLDLDEFVASFVKMGIEGIEVFYPYPRHRGIIKFNTVENVKKIAQKHNLIMTGGTDLHDDKF